MIDIPSSRGQKLIDSAGRGVIGKFPLESHRQALIDSAGRGVIGKFFLASREQTLINSAAAKTALTEADE